MNTLQLTLFPLAPTHTPPSDEDASIRRRFEEFDKGNPHVFEALKAICLEMKRQGMTRWGIKAAWEDIRWHGSLRTNGSTIKLPNDYHSLYARKLMAEVPELAGFFTTRTLRGDDYDE